MKKSIIGAAVAAAALVCSFAVAAEEVHVAVAPRFDLQESLFSGGVQSS